ncbi:hypothetical protein V6C53_01800 [Desulfocurvibacter africanus]|uniref:Uncharacterized protein n=1 Tax=Desulfocurvibacter africanus subsp. africanus str. Walvis Bay TaxID=690850 RepID=F3YWR3_DESAF|nr:hypothetical protein [Desulfocurvibacter africanus]EGJ50556.1 hypothetical protein Desaf_2229 [Desulfocurvibacter africanus subsp. africanus str. Walvis Bay]
MIVIDGQQSGHSIGNFANLEQLLVKVMDDETLGNRIVTDVLVNEEAFSEIYPHQAEDIGVRDIKSVEIRTVGVTEMAANIVEELFKVQKVMYAGSRQIAELFRQADDAEALELYQDLIDVTRDFMAMVGVLRDEFSMTDSEYLSQRMEELSELFSEIMEVVENQDWILLSDLLEYEFVPALEKWQAVLTGIRSDIAARVKG